MSRIGRMPIQVPAGVELKMEGQTLTVKGPKGTVTRTLHDEIGVNVEGNVIHVTRPNDEPQWRALHGLSRTLVSNMVTGVTTGFKKELEINGVGYRAAKEGKKLVLNLGYSHNITFEDTATLTIEVPAPNKVVVNGIDKQEVGQLAANIRGTRPPEPYKGKGVKYVDEVIRRKEGKTGKSGK